MRRLSRSRVIRWGMAMVGAVVSVGALSLGGTSAQAAGSVPYADPNSAGAVGFCDTEGHQVTSGRITDLPFAAFAVSNFVPPAPYNKPDATGVWLIAFQPRKNIDPGNWSGEQMTTSSFYTNPKFPKTEVLPQDISLKQIVDDYPPQWDGFIQLRMYFKVDNEPSYSEHYPTADIRITGDTWKLVRGGGISCTASGTARSLARTLIPQQLSSSPTVPGSSPQQSADSTTGSADPQDDAATQAKNSSSSAKSSGSSQSWLLPLVGLGALVVVGGGLSGYWKLRRRSVGDGG